MGCLVFTYKMDALKKDFDISKEWEAKDATITSLARASTPPLDGSSIFATIGVPLISPGMGQPSFRVVVAIVKN